MENLHRESLLSYFKKDWYTVDQNNSQFLIRLAPDKKMQRTRISVQLLGSSSVVTRSI